MNKWISSFCTIIKHKDEASINTYVEDMSTEQKTQCSSILSSALDEDPSLENAVVLMEPEHQSEDGQRDLQKFIGNDGHDDEHSSELLIPFVRIQLSRTWEKTKILKFVH